MTGFARGLILKQRHKVTRKWPIHIHFVWIRLSEVHSSLKYNKIHYLFNVEHTLSYKESPLRIVGRARKNWKSSVILCLSNPFSEVSSNILLPLCETLFFYSEKKKNTQKCKRQVLSHWLCTLKLIWKLAKFYSLVLKHFARLGKTHTLTLKKNCNSSTFHQWHCWEFCSCINGFCVLWRSAIISFN